MIKVLNFQEKAFIKNLTKAYTEGIYSNKRNINSFQEKKTKDEK